MKRLIYLFLILNSKVFSCQCKWEFTEFTPLHLVEYNKIYIGRILNIDKVNWSELSVTVLSKRTYLGQHQDTVKFLIGSESSMCGYHFEIGKEFLIYANNIDRHPVTRCSPTRPIDISYSDSIQVLVPSFYYTKINGKRDKYSEQEIYDYIKKSWSNELAYLDTMSRMMEGQLITKFINGNISGIIKIKNKAFSDTNYFYYHNGSLKTKGFFINGVPNGNYYEYQLSYDRIRKGQKTEPFVYYSTIGQMVNGRRKGVWTRKFIKGDKKWFESIIEWGGASINYN